MKIPPAYIITPQILELLSKIDAYRIFFQSLEIPPEIKQKFQRVSLLKSSLFSARIEGNPLTIEEIATTSNEQRKNEIFNIIKASQYINNSLKPGDLIDQKIILILHNFVLNGLSSADNRFRVQMSAIFNQSGVAVYIAPPPEKIPGLISELIGYINAKEERFPIIKVLIAHLVFEKIHPFPDGNGRVGRLLIYAILKSHGFDFNSFTPLEEYLDDHKTDYYHFLDTGLKDPNGYLIFMLEALVVQSEKIRQEITAAVNKKDMILLPPRQEELLNIIKDHKVVSFDFLKRRFLKVPMRTLRYDLKKLADAKLIIKIGKTKGSYYLVK